VQDERGMAQHEPAKASFQPGPLLGLSRWQAGRIAILLFALLVGLRAASEIAMMYEHGPDPQMPIWLMFLLVKLGLWLLGGAIAVGVLIVIWPNRLGALAALVALLVWAVAIGRATWHYNIARQALADAARPTTSPERLRELVHFDGLQAGYELDNRLAANRSTPPEALRELSQRVDQSGTQTILAKNPRTPEDVLERLHRAGR
jgi:hypothetical protein